MQQSEIPIEQQVKLWAKKATSHALSKGTGELLVSILKDFSSSKNHPDKENVMIQNPVTSKRKGRPKKSLIEGIEDLNTKKKKAKKETPSKLATVFSKKKSKKKSNKK
jgi:hypothetical protein